MHRSVVSPVRVRLDDGLCTVVDRRLWRLHSVDTFGGAGGGINAVTDFSVGCCERVTLSGANASHVSSSSDDERIC